MEKDDFENYGRRSRLYHSAFEEYDSLKTTYFKFYEASGAFKRRGRILTYGSTFFGAILLFIVGVIVVRDGPSWTTDLAFTVSILVATLSFLNAVDRPKRTSNVTYTSGQQLQRIYQEFHYFVTVRLPDPDEDLEELESEFERLRKRKNIVNETTPQLGDKWYHRVKEYRKRWEPKPLEEVTGEDGEFEKDSHDDCDGILKQVKGYIQKPIRWAGF